MNPKHISGDVVPGVTRQSIPQALRSYARNPIKALGKSWRAMGPAKGPIVGVGKVTGKVLPRAIRSLGAKIPVGYPTLNRLFFAGYTLHQLRNLLSAKDRKGERLGKLVGGTGGWLLGSRLPMIPSIAAWMGSEAIGGGLGKLYDKHISGEKDQPNVQ